MPNGNGIDLSAGLVAQEPDLSAGIVPATQRQQQQTEQPYAPSKGTWYEGADDIANATLDSIKGAVNLAKPTPQNDDEANALKVAGIGGMLIHRLASGLGPLKTPPHELAAAIHEINQSDDPVGTYLQIAQKTAAQGAGAAITSLATEGAVKGAGAAAKAVPSATRAGETLGDIKNVAGNVPLRAGAPYESTVGEIVKQSERGADLPSPVAKLSKRLESGQPLTYEEAKDFQSNISALSAEEKMALKPNTARLVGKLNAEMKESLEEAASTKGKGEAFTKSMKEYHHAMQISEMTDEAKAFAIRAAMYAALGGAGGAGYAIYKKLFGEWRAL